MQESSLSLPVQIGLGAIALNRRFQARKNNAADWIHSQCTHSHNWVGVDRGFIPVFLNDGSVHVTDHPIKVNAFAAGALDSSTKGRFVESAVRAIQDEQ